MSRTSGTKRLSRLEQKFDVLIEKQNKMQARLKAAREAIREELNEIVLQNIRRMGFPIEDPVLLIGALLEAKKKLDGPERVRCIDTYIALYNDYARAYPNLEPCTGTESLETEGEEVPHGDEPEP